MNLKLLLGIAIFLIGLVTAAMGIAGVGLRDTSTDTAITAPADPSGAASEGVLGSMAIPVIAGLSLALGGLLIGLSMGDWKHPRTHLEPGDRVVDPEGYHKMKHV
jgi:hypothetical protein